MCKHLFIPYCPDYPFQEAIRTASVKNQVLTVYYYKNKENKKVILIARECH